MSRTIGRLFRSRIALSMTAVVGVVGLGAAAAGLAMIPDPSGTIHGCYTTATGALRVIDPSSASCRTSETRLDWNRTGIQGPKGDNGAPGTSVTSTSLSAGDPNCPNGGSQFTAVNGTTYACNGNNDVFFNRNFEDVPLAAFPGVTVASLSLPPGQYVMSAKLRYRLIDTTAGSASCVFQGDGIGGLDASQEIVSPIGEATVDGFMMDLVTKGPSASPDVHIQCFGPADIHMINPQFDAVLVSRLHSQ
jgi:hypothetical protein